MKKASLILLISIYSCMSFAQDIDLGIEYSLQFYGAESKSYMPNSNGEIYLSESAGTMFTFKTGLVGQYSRFRKIGLETGLLLDFVGWKFAAENNPSLGKYRGRTLNFGLKIPLLAYYKIPMSSGGSYFFGGGMNFNYLVAGSYKYRDGDDKFHSYTPITSYSSQFDQFSMGYQLVVGVEDSEHSHVRVSYGKCLSAITSETTNELVPYYFNFTLIQNIN